MQHWWKITACQGENNSSGPVAGKLTEVQSHFSGSVGGSFLDCEQKKGGVGQRTWFQQPSSIQSTHTHTLNHLNTHMHTAGQSRQTVIAPPHRPDAFCLLFSCSPLFHVTLKGMMKTGNKMVKSGRGLRISKSGLLIAIRNTPASFHLCCCRSLFFHWLHAKMSTNTFNFTWRGRSSVAKWFCVVKFLREYFTDLHIY